MWLEIQFEIVSDGNKYVFGVVNKNNPNIIKTLVVQHLSQLMKGNNWELEAVDLVNNDCNMSLHPARKLGVNIGRCSGASRNDVDHHVR